MLHWHISTTMGKTLYQKVWDADDLGDVRTVKVHASNLRKKLGIHGKEFIHTVRGAGYMFCV